MNDRSLIRSALHDTAPVMAGYLALGLGYGLLMHSRGLGVGWTVLMSILIYAGAMQYVAVDLLATGASLYSTALMTLLINARHFFYGLSMLERYRGLGKSRLFLIFGLTDETYSLLCADITPEGKTRKRYYLLVTALDYSYWILGGLAGVLLGRALPFATTGVDFSMTALFVVIFLEQWQAAKDHTPALLGAGLSVLCLLCFGPDRFLIPSMLAILAALALLRRRLEAAHA
jgi:4-azaleucine resistance transporter AzlC